MKTFGRYSKSTWESTSNGQRSPVLVWVDTAFNGGLVLPRQQIEQLGLREYSSTPAILANGQRVELPTYTCGNSGHDGHRFSGEDGSSGEVGRGRRAGGRARRIGVAENGSGSRFVVCVGREAVEGAAGNQSGTGKRGTPRTKGTRLGEATRNPAGVGSGHRVANPQNGNGLSEAAWRRERFVRDHGSIMQPRGVLGTLLLGSPVQGGLDCLGQPAA